MHAIDKAAPETARFCTEHSLATNEPLAGNGTHQAKNILIRWPKGRWRYSLRQAEGMGAPLADAIEASVDAGWRVNLIDRKNATEHTARVFLMPENLAFDILPDDLPAFLGAVRAGAYHAYNPRPITAPLVLCCTHGKHDACCAKWGFAIYKALAAATEITGDFDVWEVTHLGGCRLSAGVMFMPAMRKYGRLSPRDVPALLTAERENRPYLRCYRGASHLDEKAQVAEVTGLKHLAVNGYYGLADIRQIDEATYTVSIAGAVAGIRLSGRETRTYGACSDLKAKAEIEPRTVWTGELVSLDLPDMNAKTVCNGTWF